MNVVAMAVGYSVMFTLAVGGLMLFVVGTTRPSKLQIAIGLMCVALGWGLVATGVWIVSAVPLWARITVTVFAVVAFVVSLLVFGNLTAKKR